MPNRPKNHPAGQQHAMKPSAPNPALPALPTLFQRAARMDVSASAGPSQPAPTVNRKTFAALRKHAERSASLAALPGGGVAGPRPRPTYPWEGGRTAVFIRMLQRKLEPNEVFRPEC